MARSLKTQKTSNDDVAGATFDSAPIFEDEHAEVGSTEIVSNST